MVSPKLPRPLAISATKLADAITDQPQSKEVVEPKLHAYYRINKISTHLYEILEVQVDESKAIPVKVSKQDTRELLMVRLETLLNAKARGQK